MSIISTGMLSSSADPADKLHKKSFHRRNDSGELDVFEAARYFSGYNEAPTSLNNNINTSSFSQKMMKEDRSWRGGRISLDMPIKHMLHHPHHHNHNHNHNHVVENKQNKNINDKKYKQPSSPGGRLASFLNSLFNQSGSKKKKSKSTTTKSMNDGEESPGGVRRRRRSSISHFGSSTTAESKFIYSSSSSGFRTPPPYISHCAPTSTTSKSYKNLTRNSDQKTQNQQVAVSSFSKYNTNGQVKEVVLDGKKSSRDNREMSWLEDHERFKYKINSSSLSDQQDHKGLLRRLSEVVDDDYDEDGESDSSSDLFELQNYDLGFYSSGLPVYETTNVDNIKIIRSSGTPISNASS